MTVGHFFRRFLTGTALAVALVAAATWVPPAGAATTCHPGAHVLAHHGGVVLWSVRGRVAGKVKTRVYLCAPPKGGAELVTSGGPDLTPTVSRLKVAGHFVAFLLTTSSEQDMNLVVFDVARARRELTDNDGCSGTRICALAAGPDLSHYTLAPNGWVAEEWTLYFPYGVTSDVSGDVVLVATNDGTHHRLLDFGSSFSSPRLAGPRLNWTSDLGGASSAVLGQPLVPPTAPLAMPACDLLAAPDLMPVLGASSHPPSTSTTQCTYTSAANPAMTLVLGVQTGLTPTQVSAYETALSSAGWDDGMSSEQGLRGFQKSSTSGGVTHQQLDAFENGVRLSLDLTIPSTAASEQLAWLTDVALERLFGVQVARAQ
jgi:hypothetical protein